MQKHKRKICVVTGSRAEYGLLYWLMKSIKEDRGLLLQVIVTGTHLEKRFGDTYRQIMKDGFKIDARVPMDLNSDSERGIIKSCGKALAGFADALERLKPDVVVILGDRYEMLMAATAALLSRLPIAHIHGGEVTQGAYDDSIRHAITKMSYLHFVSHGSYAKRVISMGEDPKRVFNFGAPGLDAIKNLNLLSKNALERHLGFKLGKDTAIVTYHPVTLEKGSADFQTAELLKALKQSGLRAVFTSPNADAENKVITSKIKAYIKNDNGRSILVRSLGQLKYLSLMKHAGLMIGNSSSGIIEAPSFKLPVVNIGSRQKGRLRAKNVIDSESNSRAVTIAIRTAVSSRFINSLQGMTNPFGRGDASKKIKAVLKSAKLNELKKGFAKI